MLFSREEKKDAKTKKRSILGYMFNPDIGTDIKPIGETFSIFVYILAAIFSSNGLFPKNHPAFSDKSGKTRLTIGEVILTAWQNTSFTKEGLPKAILFVAVIGCLVFSALFILTLLISLLLPQAHAAESMFLPPSTSSFDWGVSWIDYIFRGIAFPAGGDAGDVAVPNMCSWQGAMGKALMFYSNGILVLAGVILLYYLVAMVAETAQYGEAMGKRANKLWAPIRLVLAIGLLVPISSAAGSGGCVSGLNSGQYVVIQVAKWGSGLATNVWAQFVNALENDPTPRDCVPGSPSCTKGVAGSVGLGQAMFMNYACAETYNYYLKEELGDDDFISSSGRKQAVDATKITTEPGRYFFGATKPSNAEKICGGYNIPSYSSGDKYAEVYKAQARVFADYLDDYRDLAKKYVPCKTDNSTQGVCANYIGINKEFNTISSNMYRDLANAVKQAVLSADRTQVVDRDAALKGGWMVAGSWFNTLARMQGERAESIRSGMPTSVNSTLWEKPTKEDPPSWWERDKDLKEVKTSTQETLASLSKEVGLELEEASMPRSGQPSKSVIQKSWEVGVYSVKQVLQFLEDGGLVDIIYMISYSAMKSAGVLSGSSGDLIASGGDEYLAVKFDPSKNIWAEVISFGQNVIHAGNFLMSVGGALLLASSFNIVGTGAGPGLSAIGNIFFTLGGIVFGAGAALAFILPMHPFLRFFFGTLTWLIGLAEAVIAVPLWALAHVNPEGDGLPGGKALRGYYLILHIFLRPVLMVLGLIIAYLLFVVSVSFLNALFLLATKGTGAMGVTPFGVLPKLIYSIMYCVLVYTCGNMSFKAIGMFPQKALDWLGQGGGHDEAMGDKSVSALLAGGAMASILTGGVMKGVISAPGDVRKGFDSDAEQKRIAEINAQRHRDNMVASGMIEQEVMGKDGNPVLGKDGKPVMEWVPDPNHPLHGGGAGNGGNNPSFESLNSPSDEEVRDKKTEDDDKDDDGFNPDAPSLNPAFDPYHDGERDELIQEMEQELDGQRPPVNQAKRIGRWSDSERDRQINRMKKELNKGQFVDPKNKK